MAIELSNLTFTEQDDIVPASGVEQIVNTGIANTLAGNDSITGIGQAGDGILTFLGTINTGDGNDKITGTAIDLGINVNYQGIIDTGNGSDTITGTGGYGIQNYFTINTGDDNDKIIGNGTLLRGYGIINAGTMDTGAGNDEITGTNANGLGIYNYSGSTIDTGDGKDTITGTGGSMGISNGGTINTGDDEDIITSAGAIDNYGIINTGDGNDSIITSAGAIYNYGIINTGDGNDSLIANGGFESDPNSSGAWFLGEGEDYIKGYGSGDFYGGNGNDTLELTPGTYTVGIWGEAGESSIFTKGNQLMITSEFETLIAGGTTYNFASLTAGQIITVA